MNITPIGGRSESYWRFSYDSVSEMVDTAIKHKNTQNVSYSCEDRIRQRASSYIGRHFADYKTLANAVFERWEEGMTAFERMIKTLRELPLPRPKTIRRVASWSEDQGDEVCLERLQKGMPFWRTTSREQRQGSSTVSVIANASQSGGTDSIQVLWRAAAAVCLTELLEEAGYRVELFGCDHQTSSVFRSGPARNTLLSVKVKDANAPLDTVSVLNAMSGWCFRTIYFSCFAATGHGTNDSLGYPATAKPVAHYITSNDKVHVAEGITSERSAVSFVTDIIMGLQA